MKALPKPLSLLVVALLCGACASSASSAKTSAPAPDPWTMQVRCLLTKQGQLKGCRVTEHLVDRQLEQSTVEWLQANRYTPVTYQGKPVNVFYVFKLKIQPPPNDRERLRIDATGEPSPEPAPQE